MLALNSCDHYRHERLHNWVKWLPTSIGCSAAEEIDFFYLGLQHTSIRSSQNATDVLGSIPCSVIARYKIHYPAISLAFLVTQGLL